MRISDWSSDVCSSDLFATCTSTLGGAVGLYCGIDWAENHHDFAILNDLGEVVSRGRVDNDAAGFARLLEAFAEAGDTAENLIPVGIETDHGLWVAALRASGRVIYQINPLAASRYRSRHSVSGSKSDSADAVMLDRKSTRLNSSH